MPTEARTEPKPRRIIETIARDHLHVPTLETRRSDSLDFHEVAVWDVRAALEAAYQAGLRGRPPQATEDTMKRNTFPPRRGAMPADPALADVPCAESLVDMLTDDIGPALAAMLAKVNAAEDAYNSTKAIRDGFEHHEAEDGWASLRYYLEHAAAEVRRIVQARH